MKLLADNSNFKKSILIAQDDLPETTVIDEYTVYRHNTENVVGVAISPLVSLYVSLTPDHWPSDCDDLGSFNGSIRVAAPGYYKEKVIYIKLVREDDEYPIFWDMVKAATLDVVGYLLEEFEVDGLVIPYSTNGDVNQYITVMPTFAN